jgi:hypothetical protein
MLTPEDDITCTPCVDKGGRSPRSWWPLILTTVLAIAQTALTIAA